MQQPVFRDVLSATIEVSDREAGDAEGDAYVMVLSAHPSLTRPQFDEIVEVLVRTDHLRRWKRPTSGGALIPTAKGRLQFAIGAGVG